MFFNKIFKRLKSNCLQTKNFKRNENQKVLEENKTKSKLLKVCELLLKESEIWQIGKYNDDNFLKTKQEIISLLQQIPNIERPTWDNLHPFTDEKDNDLSDDLPYIKLSKYCWGIKGFEKTSIYGQAVLRRQAVGESSHLKNDYIFPLVLGS